MKRGVLAGGALVAVAAGVALLLLSPWEEPGERAGKAAAKREVRAAQGGEAEEEEAGEGEKPAKRPAKKAGDDEEPGESFENLPPKPGTVAEQLHLPGIDTAAELQVDDLCDSLAKDRRNLQTSLNMMELVPQQNANSVGAKRLRFVADRLDKSVQRKAAKAKKLGLECAEE